MGVPSGERLVLRHEWPDGDFSENTRGSQRDKLEAKGLTVRFDQANAYGRPSLILRKMYKRKFGDRSPSRKFNCVVRLSRYRTRIRKFRVLIFANGNVRVWWKIAGNGITRGRNVL